jgi:hypothetical protein
MPYSIAEGISTLYSTISWRLKVWISGLLTSEVWILTPEFFPKFPLQKFIPLP